MTLPSILVVDDGELARVQTLLRRLQVDFARLTHPDRETPLERPRDVLITSGPRAMTMPPLFGDGAPVWVCIYDQDFMPLRERLRELGVHYLVSGDLAPRTFELFLRQLLHGGEERRRARRIPLHCEIELDVGGERRRARLLELSRESCVFSADGALPEERLVMVRLPVELTGDARVNLAGRVVRTSGELPGEGHGVTGVLAFGELDADTAARIHEIVTGQTLGTQVTPLAPEPQEPGMPEAGDAVELDPALEVSEGWCAARDGERRGAPRHRYERRVDAVCWHGELGPQIALGRDLSISGLRVVSTSAPSIGAQVTLALYGGAREEPVVLEAKVVRGLDDGEVALHFQGLKPGQRRDLQRLLRAAPQLEQLDAEAAPLHIAELLDNG